MLVGCRSSPREWLTVCICEHVKVQKKRMLVKATETVVPLQNGRQTQSKSATLGAGWIQGGKERFEIN